MSMTAFLTTVCCLTFLSVPQPNHDLKIVTRRSLGHDLTYNVTEYFSGSRWREDTGLKMSNVNAHHLVTIVHHGDALDERFVLDLDAQEYVVYETDKNGGTVGAKTPPIQYSGGTLGIWIESNDTGERKQFFGYTARHIITRERRVPGPGSCSNESELDSDGWYIDPSVLPTWRQPLSSVTSFMVAGNCFDKTEVHRSGVKVGFPVKLTTTFLQPKSNLPARFNAVEVVEFSEAPLDPALFVIPPDFRKVSELSNMNKPHVPTAWERFKDWVQELFR
jgi:hypothetical protein